MNIFNSMVYMKAVNCMCVCCMSSYMVVQSYAAKKSRVRRRTGFNWPAYTRRIRRDENASSDGSKSWGRLPRRLRDLVWTYSCTKLRYSLLWPYALFVLLEGIDNGMAVLLQAMKYMASWAFSFRIKNPLRNLGKIKSSFSADKKTV